MADGMMRGQRAEGSFVGWVRRVYAVTQRFLADKLHGRSISILFAALYSVVATAEELPDPTRPPAIIAAPVATGPGAAEKKPLGLQSVIISKDRHAAIIDGETVELGGKHGDARLIEVNEDGVVLQGAQGRQVMTLFPGIKMTAREEVKPQSPAEKAQPAKHKKRLKQKDEGVANKEGK